MRKNLSIFAVIILVIVVIVQAYLLYTKDSNESKLQTSPSEQKEKEIKPKITINTQQELQTPKPMDNTTQPQSLDIKQLEQDIKKIFRDILGSKEVQDGLDDMKNQLQEAQKQMNEFLKEFDKTLKDDKLLDNIFKNFENYRSMQFQEKEDHYILEVPLHDIKDSGIDIQVQNKILIITIPQKDKILISIPNSAFIDQMQTEYKNDILKIIIPKIISKTDI